MHRALSYSNYSYDESVCLCEACGEVFGPFTIRHSSGTDISGQAAASGVCGMVAGHDLYCVTGEVLQVGYNCRLRGHIQPHLSRKVTSLNQITA